MVGSSAFSTLALLGLASSCCFTPFPCHTLSQRILNFRVRGPPENLMEAAKCTHHPSSHTFVVTDSYVIRMSGHEWSAPGRIITSAGATLLSLCGPPVKHVCAIIISSLREEKTKVRMHAARKVV